MEVDSRRFGPHQSSFAPENPELVTRFLATTRTQALYLLSLLSTVVRNCPAHGAREGKCMTQAAGAAAATRAAEGGAPPSISVRSGSAAAVGNIINAAIQVFNAHKSTHIPGTLNVEARTTITGGSVPFMTMVVILYKNDGITSISLPFIGAGTRLQGNAATLCIFGPAANYHGSAGAFVIFPPGYVTPVGLIGNTGAVSNINCALPPA